MVGQTILRSGNLDVKSPAKSSFASGWRLPPWKTRYVELVEGNSNIAAELHIYKHGTRDLVDTYELHDISDITMVTSKTHLHAFEIIAEGHHSILVMSGVTELESREWIWTLRKLFWPQAIPQVEDSGKLHLQLIPNADTTKLGLPTGIYSVHVSVVAIEINLVTRCTPGNRNSTPVESFNVQESVESARLPLVAIGRVKLEEDSDADRTVMFVETIPDCELGARTFIFELADATQSMDDVIDVVKSALFQATNNLHDCIAGSQWTVHKET